jgi:4-diphosphocytidyl-2-C-methyl-D-erythritol kinase
VSREPALVCRAFAKINLRLQVLGTRPDGFHELDTTLQTVDLVDELTFEPREGVLTLTGEAPGVPLDSTNLVWRAAGALWGAMKRQGEPAGVAIRLVKGIPAQAGLGGGSADAAVTLTALARLWNADLSRPELESIGGTIGSDVPFFLSGGTARARGRGDLIEMLPDPPVQHLVLVFPGFGVSTVEAYRWWDEEANHEPAASRAQADIWNDLEGPVARRHPEILVVKERLVGCGASAAAMTGSGSAVFGLFASAEAARIAASRLSDEGWVARATVTLPRPAFAVRSGLV